MSDDKANIDRQAALHAALAKAQGVMRNPDRNRTVTVKMEAGGSYTFDYATLDNIIDTARKALSDNGIAVVQCLDRDAQGGNVLITRLLHKDGGVMVNEMPVDLPKARKFMRNGQEVVIEPRIQEIGSVITYARRYAICAMLNIAAEEDDDGTAGQERDAKPRAPAGAKDKAPGAREKFVAVRTRIQKAKDAIELAAVLLEEKGALLEIKKASEAGYAELIKLSADRELEFQAGEEK